MTGSDTEDKSNIAAYKRGISCAIEILGGHMNAAGYDGEAYAEKTLLSIQDQLLRERENPTESRLRGWG